MTDINLDETRESFLFREPRGFLDEVKQKDDVWEPLAEPLLAFRANLTSAIRVGVIPFQLVHSAILEQRFNQLVIASNIHFLSTQSEPESKTEDGKKDRERRALERAHEEMNAELREKEVITRHAWSTVKVLDRHLRDNDFRASAAELLRQIIVMCWGAFEIVAGDVVRAALNAKPAFFRSVAEARPYRESISARFLTDGLEANSFDLSRKMGDLFCDEKIRDISRILIADDVVDSMLKKELLWRIFQQRNLIVHRRGIIDSRYLKNTSDTGTIGDHIEFKSSYVEESLVMVRDAGLEMIKGCHRKLLGG
jgi:hypothetical protein